MDIDNLNTQLDYLNETKQQLKQAITDKGQFVAEEDTFRSYVNKVNDIKIGTDTTNGTALNTDVRDGKIAYSKDKELVGTLKFETFEPEYTKCLNTAKQIEGSMPIDTNLNVVLSNGETYIYNNDLSNVKKDMTNKLESFGAYLNINADKTISSFICNVHSFNPATIETKVIHIKLLDKMGTEVETLAPILETINNDEIRVINAMITADISQVTNYTIIYE